MNELNRKQNQETSELLAALGQTVELLEALSMASGVMPYSYIQAKLEPAKVVYRRVGDSHRDRQSDFKERK